MQTSECDKALAVQDDSQKIGAFLDWLDEQGISLCQPHKHTGSCYHYGTIELKSGEQKTHTIYEPIKYTDEKELDCDFHNGEYVCICESFNKLLARYFNINLNIIEKEKLAILKELRNAN